MAENESGKPGGNNPLEALTARYSAVFSVKFQERMKSMKEMFEEAVNDPDLEKNPMYQECKKFSKAMDDLTADITRPCIEYANGHGEEDDGWSYTILISLARATCKVLYALQSVSDSGKDVFDFYRDELLPLCKGIAYDECDRAMSEQDDRAEDEEEKDGVTFETRKDLILAIADPDMPVDEIIDRFFIKDMDGKTRQKVASHISEMRIKHADKLREVRERAEKTND